MPLPEPQPLPPVSEEDIAKYKDVCVHFTGSFRDNYCGAGVFYGPGVFPTCCIFGEKGCKHRAEASESEIPQVVRTMRAKSREARKVLDENRCPKCNCFMSDRRIKSGPHEGKGPMVCSNPGCGFRLEC